MNVESLRILLVDDSEYDVIIIQNCVKGISETGMHLDCARTFNEGHARLSESQYDVCLVDYHLDRKTGFDFISEAIERGCNIPFIIITGQDDNEVERLVIAAGATDYLVKSELKPAILRRAIRYAIERKRIEKQIALSRDEALKSDNAKSEFIANMSHEMRTPMNGVVGMLDLLAETEINSKQREYLMLARFSAKSMMSMLDRILDYASSCEAGREDLLTEFDLRSLAEKVANSMQYNAEHKGLHLSRIYSTELPALLFGDAVSLSKILHHLLENAIKFTEQGSVELSLKSTPIQEGYIKLACEIRDTGIGVSEEQHEAVFYPFHQVDGSFTRRFGGVGLGLSIVTRIVEKMGGEIGIKSRKGEGSCFSFTLPMRIVTENRLLSPEIENTGGSTLDLQGEKLTTGNNTKLKVLLADDSKVTRTVFSHILEKNGHQVVTANDGSEAVVKFQLEPFDAILMDVQMPLMNGLNATRLIRAKELATGGHVPILALTASDTKNDLEKCLQTGMDGYIHKNVTAAELLETLDSYVNKVGAGGNSETGSSGCAMVGDLSVVFPNDNDEMHLEDNASCMKTLCRYLREALECRNEALLDKYSLRLKRLASQAKSTKVGDETLRVQLAYRRGDFDKAEQILAALESILSEVPADKGFKFDM